MNEWTDFYTPTDFYGQAAALAKKFCRKFPEAERERVYMAASEAAEMYERSGRLRMKWKFKNFCYLRIKTEIYIIRRKQEMKMDNELKAAIIRDYQTGMTAKEIAERYQLDARVTYNNLSRWAEKGLLELRKRTDKPVHTPQKEKAPESAATETSAHEKLTTTSSIAHSTEKIKPSALMKSLEVFAAKTAEAFEALYGECEIIGVSAETSGGAVVRLALEACGTRFGVMIKADENND